MAHGRECYRVMESWGGRMRVLGGGGEGKTWGKVPICLLCSKNWGGRS